jgi:hypothetical protein
MTDILRLGLQVYNNIRNKSATTTAFLEQEGRLSKPVLCTIVSKRNNSHHERVVAIKEYTRVLFNTRDLVPFQINHSLYVTIDNVKYVVIIDKNTFVEPNGTYEEEVALSLRKVNAVPKFSGPNRVSSRTTQQPPPRKMERPKP